MAPRRDEQSGRLPALWHTRMSNADTTRRTSSGKLPPRLCWKTVQPRLNHGRGPYVPSCGMVVEKRMDGGRTSAVVHQGTPIGGTAPGSDFLGVADFDPGQSKTCLDALAAFSTVLRPAQKVR